MTATASPSRGTPRPQGAGESQPNDPRRRLVALWQALASRRAVVLWVDPRALPDDVVEALCEHEARRIRALVEGEAAGWTPDWRCRSAETPDEGLDPVAVLRAVAELLPAAAGDNGDQADKQASTDPKATPIRVRRHRADWRASA